MITFLKLVRTGCLKLNFTATQILESAGIFNIRVTKAGKFRRAVFK
jgi:hypothetical protein